MNRLKSIQADAAFVSEISALFPQFPVLANERCGTWYVHPSKIHKPGVYFKSTDGHTGIWDFNLRRYNPHLIDTIIQNGGCIIVDSTRKGKRVPDALSKTIPIWCATINNAIRKRALQNLEKATAATQQKDCLDENERTQYNEAEDALLRVPALDGEKWDTRYHSLPSLISRSEHAQIEAKIEGFAEKLMRFTDLTPLTTKLLKPLRPIWLTPQSFLLKDQLPNYSQVQFLPVICLSASKVVVNNNSHGGTNPTVFENGLEERDGYLYVQGSGDDEEMWSKGLYPELFWKNEEWLLEDGISAQECEDRAKDVVWKAKQDQLEKSRAKAAASAGKNKGKKHSDSNTGYEGSQVLFTPSMELCSEIKPSPIWIGNNASGRVPDCWKAGFDMVINCGAEIQRGERFEGKFGSEAAEEGQVGEPDKKYIKRFGGLGQGGAEATLCVLPRDQWDEETSTEPRTDGATKNLRGEDVDKPQIGYYLHLPIAEGKKGQHQLLEMIPIAIQAVKDLYHVELKDQKQRDEVQKNKRPKILVHCQQGMDRSVGIALALLVACFDDRVSDDDDGGGGGGGSEFCPLVDMKTNKEEIQKRLFQIMGHRLAARPSRATLKMVNTFFMSPTDPPPAKFRST